MLADYLNEALLSVQLLSWLSKKAEAYFANVTIQVSMENEFTSISQVITVYYVHNLRINSIAATTN